MTKSPARPSTGPTAPRPLPPVRWSVVSAALLLLAGCYPGSDNEVFHRQWEADRRDRIAGMRAATRDQPRGAAVAGDALRALLRGRTHEFAYQRDPLGNARRYVEYYYFRPDGRLVFRNPPLATDPEGRPTDRWRIDGEHLCMVNGWLTAEERCFTLAVLPNGRVQYFIHHPGDETDALLTKVTTAISDGPPAIDR